MTRLGDGHLGGPREQVGQTALVPGVQVLDEDERHARVGAQVLEQLHERIKPAGGRADADDWKPTPSAPGINRAERHLLRGRRRRRIRRWRSRRLAFSWHAARVW